jgi:thymidylate synthase ThyX
VAPRRSEHFTPDERRALAPFFTDTEGPVFALVNLPEVVKGALFARYSRSGKSLRRLFLDEFIAGAAFAATTTSTVGLDRAGELYAKVFLEYGDDSVAQLGGVHLACEGVSNVLTKVLERGRLMSYLEQSTRYVPYTDRPGGRWRYVMPAELEERADLRTAYEGALDSAFETYADLLPKMQRFFARRFPAPPGTSTAAHERTVRAKSLDAVRGLLPAATRSNVGIYGSGQAFEALLLRMRAHPLAEARDTAGKMLEELTRVIPDFVRRVTVPDRGGAWSRYLAEIREAAAAEARRLVPDLPAESRPAVTLTEYDLDGEVKVAAATLYPFCALPDDRLLAMVRALPREEVRRLILRAAGERSNRRHRPGRAFERTSYRFDVLSDYGAFRDLQRHRILTIDWQPLSTAHGYVVPPEVEEAGYAGEFRGAMEASASLHDALAAAGLGTVAAYAVSMAYRVRYVMQMNAREAMHVIELRTTPQGHPSYRRVCQEMHRLIREEAGHDAIADAIRFADHSPGEQGRLSSEETAQRRGKPAAP